MVFKIKLEADRHSYEAANVYGKKNKIKLRIWIYHLILCYVSELYNVAQK